MGDVAAGGQGAIGLDQLIALNDEIAALARAGMPLERGLTDVGHHVRGSLGRLTSALGERMSRGESLPQALAAEGERLPRLYRAVVEAGVRSGRLPTALEGMATYARRYAQSRQDIGLALWYPSIVLVLAISLFMLFVARVIPRFVATFELFRLPINAGIRLLGTVGEKAHYWAPAVPALLAVFVLLWLRSGTAASLQPGKARVILCWVPWMRSMLAHFEAANFADLLALLLEHQVPLGEAIVLAAEASGDQSVIREARAIAEDLARGDSPAARLKAARRKAFPPLLHWLLATGQGVNDLPRALRQMGALYHRRAMHSADRIRVLLPTILLFVVGAGATLLYALTLFLPLTTLLNELSLD